MNFKGEIMSGNRYTEEFKEALLEQVKQGSTVRDGLVQVGVDPYNNNYRQLYERIKRQYFLGTKVQVMRASPGVSGVEKESEAITKDKISEVREMKNLSKSKPNTKLGLLELEIEYKKEELKLLEKYYKEYKEMLGELSND